MGLEAGNGFISGLVSTNPVGATDPKSQGDDHIRLIKAAVLGSFPSLGAAAVTLTAAQLNDAAQKTAANFFTNTQTVQAANTARWQVNETISGMQAILQAVNGSSGGVGTITNHAFTIYTNNASRLIIDAAGTLAGSSIMGVAFSDFARLSQSNTFTGPTQTISGASARLLVVDTGSATNAVINFRTNAASKGFVGTSHGTSQIISGDAAGDMVLRVESGFVLLSHDSVTLHHKFSSSNATTTFNGVAVSDFARVSQANSFAANQTISKASGAGLILNTTDATNAFVQLQTNGTLRGYLASPGAAAGLIAGSAVGDLMLRAEAGGLLFSGDAGTTAHFKLSAAGLLTTPNANASEPGYKGAPSRSISASTNTAASDAGGTIRMTGGVAQTFTLNSNPPTDSVIVLRNTSGNNWTIAASGTLTTPGLGTGSRTLASPGMATVQHDGSGNYCLTGAGVT